MSVVSGLGAAPCAGLGPVVGLNSADLVRSDGPGIAGLVEAIGRRRALADDDFPWVKLGRHRLPPGAVAEIDGRSIMETAVRTSDSGLEVFHDDEKAEKRTEAPGSDSSGDPQREDAAFGHGGLVLRSASRFSEELARWCDAAMLIVGAPFEVCLVRGSVSVSAEGLSGGNHFVVMPIGGGSRLRGVVDGTPVGNDAPRLQVDVGEVAVVQRFDGIEVDDGAVVVMLVGKRTTMDDAITFAIRKAGHWPVLRADLPYDLERPVTTYGSVEPVDPVELLLDATKSLERDDSLENARAWTRAMIRSVPRPSPLSPPSRPEHWVGRTVRGRFPGGIGQLDFREPGRTLLVFSGCAVAVDDHVRDGLVADLAIGADFDIAKAGDACPMHDPYCLARAADVLYSLGVVDLVA